MGLKQTNKSGPGQKFSLPFSVNSAIFILLAHKLMPSRKHFQMLESL